MLLRFKRHVFLIRSRYTIHLLVGALTINFILGKYAHYKELGGLLFWCVWTFVPCGLSKLGGFFKTYWFIVPRNLLGALFIVFFLYLLIFPK